MDDKTDAPLQPDQKEGEGEEKKDPADNLTPDHPRFKQVLDQNREFKDTIADLKDQLADINDKISTRQEETGNEDLTQEERDSLDKIERELQKKGFVRRDELEEDQRVERIARDFERLSDKYDGKNGYPKFVAEDVASHAKRYGFDSMEKAYRDLHFDAIVGTEAKRQRNAPTPPGSEKPTGAEREVTGELTPEKIAAMSDQEFAENEADIMSSFKKSVTGRQNPTLLSF